MMKTIMLVDDDPHIVKALTDHIDWPSLGLSIAGTASNGLDALEPVSPYASRCRYD